MTHSSLSVPIPGAFLALLALLLLNSAWGLKPSHEADRLLQAVEQALADNDYSQAEQHLNAARQLGIGLPPEYDFFYGKLLQYRDELSRARTHLERYVDRTGSSGRHYREALSLITQVEKERSGLARAKASASSADGTAEITWANDQQQYVEDLRALYQSADASQALTHHINSLLKFYAYGDDRVVAASRPRTPSRHQIHTTEQGEIVSLNKLSMDNNEPVTEDRFTVYGVNPYVDVRCSDASANCWLMHPVTAKPWLQIVQNEEAAAELAKALSQLIRRMQKQG